MADDKIVHIGHSKQKNSEANAIPWREIEKQYCSGKMNSAEIERQFGVRASRVRQEASRKGWQTPAQLRKRAKELMEKAELQDGGVTDKVDWVARRHNHRERMQKVLSGILEDFEKELDGGDLPSAMKISTLRDLGAVDDLMRRNSGMDIEDDENRKMINTSNFERVKPVEPRDVTPKPVSPSDEQEV